MVREIQINDHILPKKGTNYNIIVQHKCKGSARLVATLCQRSVIEKLE